MIPRRFHPLGRFPSRVAFLISSLLVCLAGMQMTRAAVPADSAKWEKDIAAFEAGDRLQAPPRQAILFLGSSSIRLWKTLAEDFPEWRVINRGFGGSQVADSLAYVDRLVLPYQPRQIVFYAGDNDLAAGKTPKQVAADFRAFVGKVRKALPQCRISYIAIKPSPSRWQLEKQGREANQRIARWMRGRKRLDFIDVWTPMLGADGRPRAELFVQDRLHLNAEGYRLWAGLVRPCLDPPDRPGGAAASGR